MMCIGLYKGDCDGLRRMIVSDNERAHHLRAILDTAMTAPSTTARFAEIKQIFEERRTSPIFEVHHYHHSE